MEITTDEDKVYFVLPPEKSFRAKLIELPDYAQALVYKKDTTDLTMTIFSHDSNNRPIELIAPFAFESEESRNLVFEQNERLRDFACSVIVAQMPGIDPAFNIENFNQSNT